MNEDDVLENSTFRDSFHEMRRQELRREFPMVVNDGEADPAVLDWNFLIFCASAISSFRTERSEASVLRVATSCLTNENTDESQKQAAVLLLNRIGNSRTVQMAAAKGLVQPQVPASLPPLLRLESIRGSMARVIPIASGERLEVNRFQREVWQIAQSNQWISVSAPTSAGKSRIVREWFLELLRETPRLTAVYLCPTRALVEEVSADYRSSVPINTGVFTMPWDPKISEGDKRVLVLTQERLHLVQEKFSDFKVDLLFVDEAQGLGAVERGILLQQVIDRAVAANARMQVIFASPLSSNPDIHLTHRPKEVSSEHFVSEAVTVNQNLLRVEAVKGKPLLRAVRYAHEGTIRNLGHIELPERPNSLPERIANVAFALGGKSGGNIVYVNGASEAEKVSAVLAQLNRKSIQNDEVRNLQKLLETVVHPDYALIDALNAGIAFHYGNMPLVVRSEIERLFSSGHIGYLVCTSTLLEGVNLPCRNIFMRNPKKGVGNPLTESDFWNLAGRAGRWGKEFQGNVVCIDTDVSGTWENLPLVRKRSKLILATTQGLARTPDLLEYIDRSERSAISGPEEYLFSYLCSRYAAGRDLTDMLSKVPEESLRDELRNRIGAVVDNAPFPKEIISRHSGVSPFAMERLLASFSAESDLENLWLPGPTEGDSKLKYQRALCRIGEHVTTAFGSVAMSPDSDKRKWQLANLIVNWMLGVPLPMLIDQRIYQRKNIPAAIRGVLSDVENIVRFHAPKHLALYEDLVRVEALRRGQPVPSSRPDVVMLLELGVSKPNEVALTTLGLSRTSTVALAAYVPVEPWMGDEALNWLSNFDIKRLPLPKIVEKEVLALRSGLARLEPPSLSEQ